MANFYSKEIQQTEKRDPLTSIRDRAPNSGYWQSCVHYCVDDIGNVR